MRYFISDYHLFHHNIIRYTNRPFYDLKEMHQVIRTKHNEVVTKDDEVYILGDITMGRSHLDNMRTYIDSLNGHKHLIVGNHDKFPIHAYFEIGFDSVHTSLDIKLGHYDVTLVHDPAACIKHGHIYICGHVHELWDQQYLTNTDTLLVNVSVEVVDYIPQTVHQLVKRITDELKKNRRQHE